MARLTFQPAARTKEHGGAAKRPTSYKTIASGVDWPDLRHLAVLLSVLLFVVAGCSEKGQLFEKTIPAPTLANNLLGDPDEQPIAVYLPPTYASTSNRYPVVYLLPGFVSGVSDYLDGTFQGFRLLQSMDSLITNGVIREMIVVVVNGQNFLGGSGYVNSPVTGNWEDFVVKNVVRYVDRNYKTLPYTASRGIAGHSLGGFGALSLAMRHPRIFGSVYAVSPVLFDDDGLRQMGMFANPGTVAGLLEEQDELGSMNRRDAHEAFRSIVEQLNVYQKPRDYGRLITYAYGAAFSPAPEANAPYIRYPYRDSNGEIELDAAVWETWERGFGGIAAGVEEFMDNLRELDAITLEFGTREESAWVSDGCRYLSQRLNAAGIPHDLVTFEGGHNDRVGQRLEEHVLPAFSRVLSFQ